MSRLVAGWALGLALGMPLALGMGAAAVAQGPVRRQIYPESADPKAEIAKGLAQAKREHKRVILDFGGDWCGDCQVLDIYFHQGPNLALLQKNFVLVHVFVVEAMDNPAQNALGAKYGVPIAKGVPALAILDADGHVIYAQKTGQFNDMRHMDPGSVNEFLNRWKG
jgi:thiol:disulfide interchange protein